MIGRLGGPRGAEGHGGTGNLGACASGRDSAVLPPRYFPHKSQQEIINSKYEYSRLTS